MKSIRLVALTSVLVLVACNKSSPPAVEAAAKPVATVNGTIITRDVYDFFVKSISGKVTKDLTDEQRRQLLDNLVRAEVVAQQATKDGLDQKGDTPILLLLSRLQLLEQASSEAYLKGRKATDAELKAEYELQVAALPKTQYKAHHILVKTEAEAKSAIERINKGQAFETVAKAVSLDSSGANGGDLGDFFSPTAMVKPFADAILALKKGEMTATPVQTEFGWHVIRLDDTRETSAPPFDSVKDRIEQFVQAKKFRAYSDELLKNAKIEKTL